MRRSKPEIGASKQSGATILEVLVVLTIIALISAVVGPRLIGYLGRAKSETAKLQIQQLKSAAQLYYIDLGRYPTESEGLAVLFQAPAGASEWAGPYLDSEEALSDPWGRDYLYAMPESGGTPAIMTLGRDGAKGGSGEDADISL